MATKSRKQKIAEDTADDAFLENANLAAAWVEKNSRMIAIGALALVAVTGGGLWMQSSDLRGASEVTGQLTSAIDEYREATDPATVMTSTIPGELKAQYEKALPVFEKLIAGSPQHGAADIARLYAGDLARRAGDQAKALQHFEAYVAKSKQGDIALFFALEGAGYAAEDQGKNDVALKHFEALTKLPNDYYKDYGLKHVARIHEVNGDKAKAIAAYKTIVDDLPDSKLRDFADARIAALE